MLRRLELTAKKVTDLVVLPQFMRVVASRTLVRAERAMRARKPYGTTNPGQSVWPRHRVCARHSSAELCKRHRRQPRSRYHLCRHYRALCGGVSLSVSKAASSMHRQIVLCVITHSRQVETG